MRGGERLVNECSWMSGICSGFYHSTGKSKTLRYRCPSSVMVNNRFRSADYLPCQLFNFGMIATGNHNFERFAALCNTLGGSQGTVVGGSYHSTGCLLKSGAAGGCYPPLQLVALKTNHNRTGFGVIAAQTAAGGDGSVSLWPGGFQLAQEGVG